MAGPRAERAGQPTATSAPRQPPTPTPRHLIRPARADEPDPGVFPGWLRQRIEAIIRTLKHRLGLNHPGRVPTGLWARVVQRLLALNAAIWFDWQIPRHRPARPPRPV